LIWQVTVPNYVILHDECENLVRFLGSHIYMEILDIPWSSIKIYFSRPLQFCGLCSIQQIRSEVMEILSRKTKLY
jgi:hypothetical protein